MVSWFKRRGRSDDADWEGDAAVEGDPTESTVEVKAQVIAEADARPPAGIGADGVVNAADFTESPRSPGDDPATADGRHEMDAMLLQQALAERRTLVQLCLYALDRARSAGVAERLEEGLAGVGVSALRPDGDRFDPAHHEAGGTVATDDDDRAGLVAETEVVGFSDRGDVLRVPIVTVYSKDAH